LLIIQEPAESKLQPGLAALQDQYMPLVVSVPNIEHGMWREKPGRRLKPTLQTKVRATKTYYRINMQSP
jgi:hypothetical protein